MEMICEIAPAKVNLTLEIIGRRDDGYHDIESVMQTIDICDVLTFWENEWIQVVPEYSGLPAKDMLFGEDKNNYLFDNLVYKAALLLKEETGYSSGALINLRKSIPSAAGLGGGSSDAAATLRGLNQLWKLNLSQDDLAQLGAKIGSDVPYFIYGGTCVVTGRGEKVKKVKDLKTKWMTVILLPLAMPNKTAKLYSYINPYNYSGGEYSSRLLDKLGPNNGGNNFQSELFNVFERVYSTQFKQFSYWIDKLQSMGIAPIHLAGSGPAVYFISSSREKVRDITRLLEGSGLSNYVARTVP